MPLYYNLTAEIDSGFFLRDGISITYKTILLSGFEYIGESSTRDTHRSLAEVTNYNTSIAKLSQAEKELLQPVFENQAVGKVRCIVSPKCCYVSIVIPEADVRCFPRTEENALVDAQLGDLNTGKIEILKRLAVKLIETGLFISIQTHGEVGYFVRNQEINSLGRIMAFPFALTRTKCRNQRVRNDFRGGSRALIRGVNRESRYECFQERSYFNKVHGPR